QTGHRHPLYLLHEADAAFPAGEAGMSAAIRRPNPAATLTLERGRRQICSLSRSRTSGSYPTQELPNAITNRRCLGPSRRGPDELLTRQRAESRYLLRRYGRGAGDTLRLAVRRIAAGGYGESWRAGPQPSDGDDPRGRTAGNRSGGADALPQRLPRPPRGAGWGASEHEFLRAWPVVRSRTGEHGRVHGALCGDHRRQASHRQAG